MEEFTVSGLENVLHLLDPETLKQRVKSGMGQLAVIGANAAKDEFASAQYETGNDATVTVDVTDNGYNIIAEGESVLFIEFGAGIRYSSQRHPLSDMFGFGAGTYNPDSPNWANPKGWWFKENGEAIHTYGNPPNMPMYHAGKKVIEEAPAIIGRAIADVRY